MPSCSTDIQGDLEGGNDLTISCLMTVGGIEIIFLRFLGSLQFLKSDCMELYEALLPYLCLLVSMRPPGEKNVNKGYKVLGSSRLNGINDSIISQKKIQWVNIYNAYYFVHIIFNQFERNSFFFSVKEAKNAHGTYKAPFFQLL